MYVSKNVRTYVRMNVLCIMHACMFVCMYVCACVRACVCTYKIAYGTAVSVLKYSFEIFANDQIV